MKKIKYFSYITLVSLIFSCFSINSMEKIPTRRLIIKNNSSWRLKIDGKLLELGKHILIRTIPEKITYQPYGPVGKILGTPQTINLNQEAQKRNLQFDPNIDEDLLLTINIPYTRWAPTINLEIQPAAFSPLEIAAKLPGNPWEAFPSLMTNFSNQFYWFRLKNYVSHLNKNYPQDLARYVLGLSPSPSRKDISTVYHQLSLLWSPDKHPEAKGKPEEILYTQIFKILGRAKEILLNEPVNKPEKNFHGFLQH